VDDVSAVILGELWMRFLSSKQKVGADSTIDSVDKNLS